jgi:hypothetical protein
VNVRMMRVATVAEISQGRELFYACKACGNSLKLLDDQLRGWFIYSIVIGAALAGFGAWVPAGFGPILVVVGIALVLGFSYAVARDGMARRKHPPRWPSR